MYSWRKIIEESSRLFNKAAKKYDIPSGAFDLFLSMVFTDVAAKNGMKIATTKMAKLLGFTDILAAGKLNVDIADMKVVAQIKELHAQTKTLYERCVLQNMDYELDYEKHNKHGKVKNYYNHVHPVVAALFGQGKEFGGVHDFNNANPNAEQSKLSYIIESNIGHIVASIEKGHPIETAPDFELYRRLVLDVTNIQSSKNPIVDLYNRYELQTVLWNEIMCFRSGKYYDCRLDKFLACIEKYKNTVYEAPDYSFIKDNGSIVRRLFSAFSYRPINVRVKPVKGSTTHNSNLTGNTYLSIQGIGNIQGNAQGFTQGNINLFGSNPSTFQYGRVPVIGIENITSIPILNIKIKTPEKNGEINLNDSLKSNEWFLHNGMMVNVEQEVIKCDDQRDVFVIHTDRRETTLKNENVSIFSFGKTPLIQYTSGWEYINDSPINFKSILFMAFKTNNEEMNADLLATGCNTLNLASAVYYHTYKDPETKKQYPIGSVTAFHNNLNKNNTVSNNDEYAPENHQNNRTCLFGFFLYLPLLSITNKFKDTNQNYPYLVKNFNLNVNNFVIPVAGNGLIGLDKDDIKNNAVFVETSTAVGELFPNYIFNNTVDQSLLANGNVTNQPQGMNQYSYSTIGKISTASSLLIYRYIKGN